MESNRPQEENRLLNTLAEVMPLAREIAPGDRGAFVIHVRQWLQQKAEEESRATSIYRPGEARVLQQLVASLPWNTEEEILRHLHEMQLPALERELEAAHWAFRHQSVAGDFLLGEELIPFRLVRFRPNLYLLLASCEREEIIAGFNQAFSREPSACTGSALRTDGEQWSGWVWETGGDSEQSQAALQRIREIWKATGA